MIKRLRQYAKVTGYELDDNDAPKLVEHIVDGAYRDVDRVKERASRKWNGFMPTSVEFHRQNATMSDTEFYKHATFGEDVVVTFNDSKNSFDTQKLSNKK